MIAAVDRLGLRNSTIIVLWGDHGQNLGEHNTYVRNYPSTRLLTPSPGTAR
jgi:iduronate 2-sulfatase